MLAPIGGSELASRRTSGGATGGGLVGSGPAAGTDGRVRPKTLIRRVPPLCKRRGERGGWSRAGERQAAPRARTRCATASGCSRRRATVFAAGGAGASLEAVARAAGVGIGTLYRHFPTREALFQAVYRHEVDELVDLAAQLAAGPDPVEALRRWLHANVGMIATKRGMLAALAPAPDSSKALYADLRRRLVDAIAALMRRPQAEGAMRADVAPEEVLQALHAIAYGRDDPGWQAAALRLIDIFVDGLHSRPRP